MHTHSSTTSTTPEAVIAAALLALIGADDVAAKRAAATDCGVWNHVRDALRDARARGGAKAAAALLQTLITATPRLAALLQHAPSPNGSAPDPFGGEPPILDEPLPPFPVDALPSVLRDFAQHAARWLEVPVEAAAMLTLAAVSAAATGKLWFRTSTNWEELGVLYVIVVLEPGSLKSAMIKLIFEPVFAWERERTRRAKEEIDKAKSRLALLQRDFDDALKRAKSGDASARAEAEMLHNEIEKLKALRIPRFILDDVTVERLASVLASDLRAAIISAEDTFLNILAGRYSDGRVNLALFCKAWSGEYHAVDRQTRTEIIERAALTVALAVQSTAIHRSMGNAAFEGQGAVQRFLAVMPDAPGGAYPDAPPAPIPARVQLAYNAMIEALLSLQQCDSALYLQPDAEGERLLRKLRNDMRQRAKPGGDLADIAGWAAKAHGHAARLAVALHAAEHARAVSAGENLTIPAATVERAIQIVYALIQHARRFHAVARHGAGAATTNALIAWIAARNGQAFTARDVQRAMRSVFPTAESAKRALSQLEERNVVARKTVPTAGRTRVEYVAHPDLAATINRKRGVV